MKNVKLKESGKFENCEFKLNEAGKKTKKNWSLSSRYFANMDNVRYWIINKQAYNNCPGSYGAHGFENMSEQSNKFWRI